MSAAGGVYLSPLTSNESSLVESKGIWQPYLYVIYTQAVRWHDGAVRFRVDG